ncbi:MAG: family 16 glycosylhydrolase, partial [Gammaproteobacteria bacterium]|nr:family 16 glycosylhydrolase [Gammaproteobacteria bacterium]
MHFNRLAQWLRIPAIALFSVFIASCGSGGGEDSVDASGSDSASSELRVIFRDDFGGPAARPASPRTGAMIPPAALPVGNWVVETGYGAGGWGNDEWQLYQNSMDNIFTENGSLVIRAQCATAPACGKRDGSITSARVITKDRLNVRYGNIKARIKMPSGAGMWPAFWTLGSDIDERPWPDAGEIDIVEMHYFYSDTKTTHFTTHWSGPRYTPTNRPSCASGVGSLLDPAEEENCKTNTKTFDEPLTDDFHIYELDWSEGQIVGKIDGITYFTQPIDVSTMEEFLKDHFLILNVAVGGTLGGMFGPAMTAADWADTDQTDMLVDWVEVSERIPPSTGTLIDESGNNLSYNRIINTAEFNGAFVDSDLDSTAVTPLVGSTVLELNYSTSISPNGGVPAFFSGAIFDFNQIDLSSYTKMVFSIDFSQFPGFDDISIEFQDSRFDPGGTPPVFDGAASVLTSAYTPVAVNGNWRTYEIPLRDFAGVNLDDITAIGYFNPVDVGNNLIAGTLFLDDIRFVTEACTAVGSVEFNADDYASSLSTGSVSVNDACAASALAVVKIETGFGNVIVVGVDLDAAGQGSTNFNFGSPTNDGASTIAIAEGDLLTATYTDTSGAEQLDMATVSGGGGTTPTTLGLYSETNTNPVLPYSAIINGADFGGNQTIADENSTAVTPFDGSVSLSVDFQDTGSTYGGAIFDIGGGDVSAYDSLRFAIDTSAV